ncbi:ABC transporter substrate-binding protein [Lentibacter algarum]|nr:ABC transporter substrate-binding protein [Lentibacter algarum]
MPALADRLPREPSIIDLEAKGRVAGVYGGTLNSFITRRKDTRLMVVYGYARLVGYDAQYQLQPDILRAVETSDNKRFVLRLRAGHRWSDGAAFTSEDLRYWWEDIANNEELNPTGPPDFMRVNGALPVASFPDAQTAIFEWPEANLDFLHTLAKARPPFIYRPAHYLKQFHKRYSDTNSMQQHMARKKVLSWAALHNKYDNMYKNDNHELPTLQPWMLATTNGNSRFLFVRNPYFHRVDTKGRQLPYIDIIEMNVVGPGLVATKANAGETELQGRGLSFKDVSVLKLGEADGGDYQTHLWESGVASQIAIYPNLNYADQSYRRIFRDVRFRRALSLGIDRRILNRALYFGLAAEGGMTVLPDSPFYRLENLKNWATHDPDQANKLLDDMGLLERNSYGVRLLDDGRPLRMIVETAGERPEVEDALQIISDTWNDIGVELVIRRLDRDILRNRVYAGQAMAAAWYGWDNGLPQPDTPPYYVAPRQQEFLSWPKWGQHFQSGGRLGEKPDLPAAIRLMELADDWAQTADTQLRSRIWQEMIDIHADQVFAIGLLNGAPQPVVVSKRLRNVPERAVWAWDPGAHFGVQRMDEFFFEEGTSE